RRDEPAEQARVPAARLRAVADHERARVRLQLRRRGVSRRARGGAEPRPHERAREPRTAPFAALTTSRGGHTTFMRGKATAEPAENRRFFLIDVAWRGGAFGLG